MLCLCSNSLAAQDHQIASGQLAELDSLLLEGDTLKVRAIAGNDSSQTFVFRESRIPLDWDSVRASYSDLLNQISAGIAKSDSVKAKSIDALEGYRNRYQKEIAGPQSQLAYQKSQRARETGLLNDAVMYITIANFFRTNYVNSQKRVLVYNADRLDTLLFQGGLHIRLAQQDRALDGGFNDIDEANRLFSLYKNLDRNGSLFLSLPQTLRNRYEAIGDKLNSQQFHRTVEETSEFKEIGFEIGISAGGFIPVANPYPLFYYLDDRTIELSYADQTFAGISGSLDIAYFINDFLFIEAAYSFAKANIPPPTMPRKAGEFLPFYPKTNRPMTYSSAQCIATYLFRIKTGIRPVVGIGGEYSTVDVPGVPVTSGFVSDHQRIGALRLAVRGGVEYLPSKGSHFSYSAFVDCSIRISSAQDMAILFIHPFVRISWLF